MPRLIGSEDKVFCLKSRAVREVRFPRLSGSEDSLLVET